MPSSDSAQDDSVRDFRSPRGLIALWFAVLVGPLAWAAGLTAAYSLVHTACARGTMLPLHLVSLVTLLAALAGVPTGWHLWRKAGLGVPADEWGTLPRSQFMAALGVIGSAYFALVILAQWVGTVMLHPCMGI